MSAMWVCRPDVLDPEAGTAVLVVPGREVRECRHPRWSEWGPWHERCDRSDDDQGHQIRTRAIPVDVDLTVECPECKGRGVVPTITPMDEGGVEMHATCSTCEGTRRVVRVGCVTEQCSTGVRPMWLSCAEPALHVPAMGFERRQALSYVAHAGEALPVVGNDDEGRPVAGAGDYIRRGDDSGRLFIIGNCERSWSAGSWSHEVTDQPWATDLRPGDTVVLLSDLRPVEPPITEMVDRNIDTEGWYTSPLAVERGQLVDIEVPT